MLAKPCLFLTRRAASGPGCENFFTIKWIRPSHFIVKLHRARPCRALPSKLYPGRSRPAGGRRVWAPGRGGGDAKGRARALPRLRLRPPACDASAPSSHRRPASPSRGCLVAAMSTFLVRTQRGLPPASSSPGLPSAPAASRALVHLPCRLYRLRRHLRRQRLSAGHRWSRIVIKRACLFRDDRARFTIKCARGSILR